MEVTLEAMIRSESVEAKLKPTAVWKLVLIHGFNGQRRQMTLKRDENIS